MRRVIATVVGTVISLVLLLSFKTHSVSSSHAAVALPAVSTPSAAGDPSAQPSVQPSSSAAASAAASAEPDNAGAASAAPTTSAPKTAAPTTAAPATTKKATGTAKQVVQGDAVDTRYGAVQVQVTLSGSSITDVAIVQVPNREQRDIEINDYAVPILRQEALQTQSAQIQMVSGATYTSVGYAQSLQSALDKAKTTS